MRFELTGGKRLSSLQVLVRQLKRGVIYSTFCLVAVQRRLARYAAQAGVQVTAHRLRHTLATRLINQGMPIHSLRKPLGHQYLTTTQTYARIYDETLYEQFKTAMSRLEAIAVNDWPGVDIGEPALAENWTARPI
jgi:integrase